MEKEDFYQKLKQLNFSDRQANDLIQGLNTGAFPISPLKCPHHQVNADLYGATCIACGKITAGQGFNSTAEHCTHIYEFDEFDNQVCTYCGKPK